jgi:hypothetical protein
MSATVIIILSVLLTALLVWKEWQRPKRKHLALRLTGLVAGSSCIRLHDIARSLSRCQHARQSR